MWYDDERQHIIVAFVFEVILLFFHDLHKYAPSKFHRYISTNLILTLIGLLLLTWVGLALRIGIRPLRRVLVHAFSPFSPSKSNPPVGRTGMCGRLIVFEGLDGAGKTTQSRELVDALKSDEIAVHLLSWSKLKLKKFRRKLEATLNAVQISHAQLAYFRMQLEDEIIPRLRKGDVARGLSTLDEVLAGEKDWRGESWEFPVTPDLVLFLDVATQEAVERVRQRRALFDANLVHFFNRAQRYRRPREDMLGRDMDGGYESDMDVVEDCAPLSYYEAGLDMNFDDDPMKNFLEFHKRQSKAYQRVAKHFKFTTVAQTDATKVAEKVKILSYEAIGKLNRFKREVTATERVFAIVVYLGLPSLFLSAYMSAFDASSHAFTH